MLLKETGAKFLPILLPDFYPFDCLRNGEECLEVSYRFHAKIRIFFFYYIVIVFSSNHTSSINLIDHIIHSPVLPAS